MHCMVASSIPCKLSLCADRAHACAGDSYVSSAINVACPTTQSVLAIASPHELHGDSWPSSSTGTRSFCCNHQYSVTAVTTSTGAIAERYAYTAYGQPTILDVSASVLSSSAINNRYTYTGREWDATLGLHHFRARWMSPSAGRFLTRDPIGFKGSRWNLYRNDFELNDMDPSGLRKVCCEFRLGWTISDFITKELECDSGKSAWQCCKDYGSTWHRLWAVEGASDGPCKQSPEKCQLALVPIETTVLTTTTVATNCGKVLRIHPVVQIAYVTLCVNKYYVGNDDGDLPDEDDPPKDKCLDDYEACLDTVMSTWQGKARNRCWDCYLACASTGVWRRTMNRLRCDYWNTERLPNLD
jgi:RHS repeat-associated protein